MEIYKTVNLLDGKVYIGKNSTSNVNYLGSGRYFKNAIKKYGKENFKKEILEVCLTKEQLDEREIYWIHFYNSQNPDIGYNIQPGGEGGDTYSNLPFEQLEQIKHKISVGVKKSIVEGRLKMPDTRKEKNGMWGKTHTEEVKNNLRQRLQGKTLEEIHGEKKGSVLREKFKVLNSGKNNPCWGKTPKKLECEFCKKIIDVRNLNRWHGTKCKKYIQPVL